mgnify:CR=1 FL=1
MPQFGHRRGDSPSLIRCVRVRRLLIRWAIMYASITQSIETPKISTVAWGERALLALSIASTEAELGSAPLGKTRKLASIESPSHRSARPHSRRYRCPSPGISTESAAASHGRFRESGESCVGVTA